MSLGRPAHYTRVLLPIDADPKYDLVAGRTPRVKAVGDGVSVQVNDKPPFVVATFSAQPLGQLGLTNGLGLKLLGRLGEHDLVKLDEEVCFLRPTQMILTIRQLDQVNRKLQQQAESK